MSTLVKENLECQFQFKKDENDELHVVIALIDNITKESEYYGFENEKVKMFATDVYKLLAKHGIK